MFEGRDRQRDPQGLFFLEDLVLVEKILEAGAVQCGFCTAGLILSTHALLRRVPDPDDATISHWLEAHVCRCTGYTAILNAVRLAARRMAAKPLAEAAA